MTPRDFAAMRARCFRAEPTLKTGASLNSVLAAACLACLGSGYALGQARPDSGTPRCHVDDTADKPDQHPDIHKLRDPESKPNCDEDRIINDRERLRMEKYFADLVPKDTVVKTLTLRTGDVIDCVDVFKQPALRRRGMEGHRLQFSPRGEPRGGGERSRGER